MHGRNYKCIQSFGRKISREELRVYERIIFQRILEEQGGKLWTGYIWLRIGTSDGFFEHDNETLVSIRGGELLNQLSEYQLLKDSAVWLYSVFESRIWMFTATSNVLR
jgi:hypothetical protein